MWMRFYLHEFYLVCSCTLTRVKVSRVQMKLKHQIDYSSAAQFIWNLIIQGTQRGLLSTPFWGKQNMFGMILHSRSRTSLGTERSRTSCSSFSISPYQSLSFCLFPCWRFLRQRDVLLCTWEEACFSPVPVTHRCCCWRHSTRNRFEHLSSS